MIRHRNRHDFASSTRVKTRSSTNNKKGQLTEFHLRVIQHNCLLHVRAAHLPRSRDAPERRNPPQRENDKPDEEHPRVYGRPRSRLSRGRQAQRPRRFERLGRSLRIAHVERRRILGYRGCVGGDEGTYGDRGLGYLRHTPPWPVAMWLTGMRTWY